MFRLGLCERGPFRHQGTQDDQPTPHDSVHLSLPLTSKAVLLRHRGPYPQSNRPLPVFRVAGLSLREWIVPEETSVWLHQQSVPFEWLYLTGKTRICSGQFDPPLHILRTFWRQVTFEECGAEHVRVLHTNVHGNIVALAVVDKSHEMGGIKTTAERHLALRRYSVGIDEPPSTAQECGNVGIAFGLLPQRRDFGSRENLAEELGDCLTEASRAMPAILGFTCPTASSPVNSRA